MGCSFGIDCNNVFQTYTYMYLFDFRKLKNREAAQTSRDRKKARLDELEKTVRLFQKSVSCSW